MAGSSQSTSTTRSQSTSDTYIPEYSESPILQEIAQHARAMSDVVYNWGMERFNKNQGDIDGLMRDALSYASPQRIAVDMGMAEAGVQQAGERGRLSAVRDLESYGIDPSSGRYQQLDSANRVMTAAAAAGAGNQQRMADQAAGNAMRNQAIAATLQNAQFGAQAGRDANALLQTGMSLKYPPLGRASQSTSATDSQSTSEQGDPGGGSKSGGSDGGGGSGSGGAKAPSQPPAPKAAAAKPSKPEKPPPKQAPGPEKPEEEEEPKEEPKEELTEPYPEEYQPAGGTQPTDEPTMPDYDRPTDEPTMPDYDRPTDEPTMPDYDRPTDEPTMPDLLPGETLVDASPYGSSPYDEAGMQAYNPYADQPVTADAFGIDPATGLPVSASGDQQAADETSVDEAGALFGLNEAGDWALPVSYDNQLASFDSDTWSDMGQGTMAEDPGAEAYVPTYEDPGYQEPSYEDPGYQDPGYQDPGYDDPYAGWGEDSGYDDPYADWGEEDYYDAYGGDETYYDDYEDYSDEDYYADDADYGDEDYYGDSGEEDYYDEDYYDEDYYGDSGEEDYYGDVYSDESYDSSSDDSYSDDSYSDYGGEEYDGGDYARGGQVRQKRRRRRMPPGNRPPRRPMPTGFRPRPQAIQRSGMLPENSRPSSPPPFPGARLAPPPQPPRPARGAPMAAPGGPRPAPMGRGPRPMPGNFISANGMPPPTGRPQRMAGGGQAGQQPEPTRGGFVSRELSPSGGSKVDDVQARLNAGEFVIPKDVATWKGKEFFYKMIAQARKMRSGDQQTSQSPQKMQTGFGQSRGMQ